MKKSYLNNEQTIEQNNTALQNAKAQSIIAKEMASMGYTAEELDKGIKMNNSTLKALQQKDQESDEAKLAAKQYTDIKKNLNDTYMEHRRKGKMIFRRDEEAQITLRLVGSVPDTHAKWVAAMQKFYTNALTNNKIKTRLAKFRVDAKELNHARAEIDNMEQARLNYLRELGESQEATRIKDEAMDDLSVWMEDFYIAAEIALENKPQLLESLGITVKR